MNILKFPDIKLNSTYNIFDTLKSSKLYHKLSKFDDVVFINIDSNNLHELYQDPVFYNKWFNDNKFKIAIIHEVYKDSLPFLKVADHLIFFNDIQANIIKNVIKMNIPYSILPYPKIEQKSNIKKRQILFSADFNKDLCDKYLHIASTWQNKNNSDVFDIIEIDNSSTKLSTNKDIKLNKYHFIALFNVSDNDLINYNSFFNEFNKILLDNTDTCEVIHINDNKEIYNKLLSESEYSYIFNEEMSISEANTLINNESEQIIYTNATENASLATSLAHDCKIIITEGISTVNLNNRPSVDDYIISLLDIISKYKDTSFQNKEKLKNNINIDGLDDLNIIKGKPLTNQYVFVINFRNQKDKIHRCIESIINQNKSYDFGIAITDDYSSDNSLDIVNKQLKNCNIDHIITRTNSRKYSARNLYNAVNLLVSNPESIIIELDGDDFLYQSNTLDILDKYYKKGILKTFGNFITYPYKWEEMENNTVNIDTSTPWHQGKCSAWLPLRTYKKHLFKSIEIDYFLNRETKEWLTQADDASINPRMIELANDKIKYIKDILYVYDTSGQDHDVTVEWSPIPSYKNLYHVITF